MVLNLAAMVGLLTQLVLAAEVELQVQLAQLVLTGPVAGLQVRLAQLEPIEVLRGLVLELVVELTEVAMVLPSWQPATSVGLRT